MYLSGLFSWLMGVSLDFTLLCNLTARNLAHPRHWILRCIDHGLGPWTQHAIPDWDRVNIVQE